MVDKIVFWWGVFGGLVILSVWLKALWVVGDTSVACAIVGFPHETTKG